MSGWISYHRKFVLGALLLITVFLGWQASQLKINATPYFLDQSHSSRIADSRLKETFSGSGEVLMVTTVTDEDTIFNEQSLQDLYNFTLQLETLTLTDEGDTERLDEARLTDKASRLVDSILEAGFSPKDLNDLGTLRSELAEHQRLTPAFESYLTDLAVRLRPIVKIRNVVRVESITSADDELDIHQLMRRVPETPAQIQSLKEEALGNPLLNDILFSDQPRAVNSFLELAILQDDAPNMRRIYAAVLDLVDQMGLVDSYHLGGPPAIFAQTSATMEEDSNTLFPGVFLVVMILLYVLFRDLRSVVLPMLVAVLSVVWTLGTMAFLGFQQNIVSTILPVFLISIGVADSIHYLSEYRRQRALTHHAEALKAALVHLWKPMLMTTVTTAIGFLSLSYTDIVFIKEFGYFVALGIFYAYLLTVMLLPSILAMLKDQGSSSKTRETGIDRAIDRLVALNTHLVLKQRKAIYLTVALGMIPIGYAISKLSIDNEMIGYFNQETRIYKDNEVIKKHFGGAATVEFTLSSQQVDYFKTSESLQFLEALEAKLLSHPNVGAVYGLPGFLKLINRAITDGSDDSYRIPHENPELIPQYYFLYESSNGDDIRNVVDSRYQQSRLVAFVDSDQTSIMDSIVSDLTRYVDAESDGSLTLTPSGFGEVLISTRDEVIYSQMTSLALSLAGILLLLCVLFKSVTAGLIGIIPLAFTVFINFSLMPVFGMFLDVGTAIVAPIAIGVGVDYAIYFLNAVRRQSALHQDIDQAIHQALKELYRPIGFNTVVLGCGFMVLSLSSHESLRNLGWLISCTMFISALITLTLLPVLARSLKLFQEKKNTLQETHIATPTAATSDV